MNKKALDRLLWSIAFPGFGQYLNGKLFKGTIFIFLEFLINVMSNFNKVIKFSFQGDIENAILHTNYQWLMFYPCLYFFAMWDAVKDAGGDKQQSDYLPYVFAAYFVTVGLIYSENIKIFGLLLGPVWLSILSVLPGVFIGLTIKRIINKLKT